MEAARELLDLGADVMSENARGSTPLHFAAAAKARTREICELLLDCGADTGFSDLQARCSGRSGCSMCDAQGVRGEATRCWMHPGLPHCVLCRWRLHACLPLLMPPAWLPARALPAGPAAV